MDLETVRWESHLARLELTDAELQTITRQLTNIVDYVGQLNSVDTDGIEPLAHPLPLTNVFHGDEPCASLSPDQALANAPQRVGDFFGVPAVLD